MQEAIFSVFTKDKQNSIITLSDIDVTAGYGAMAYNFPHLSCNFTIAMSKICGTIILKKFYYQKDFKNETCQPLV